MKNINKIVYIIKPSLEVYPPCVSQIRIIKDLGYNIEVWYGYCGEETKNLLASCNVAMKHLEYAPDSTTSYIGKLKNWAGFRRAVYRAMAKEPKDSTLFWFGTAESAMPLSPLKSRVNAVMSVLELMDDDTLSRTLSARFARKCLATSACEDTRANIMKFWWHLDQKPFVIPNKPYEIAISENEAPSTLETVSALAAIGDREFVIYQGIFQNIEYISTLAQALKSLDKKLLLVMMGSDRRGIVPDIKEIYPETLYIPHIQSPAHLEVTSHAAVGVVCYDHTSLNKLYCAPNKIFEYSKFGIPILANDVPGLINTVGSSGAGLCVDLTSVDETATALNQLLNNREEFRAKALCFYESVDNRQTIQRLLEGITAE